MDLVKDIHSSTIVFTLSVWRKAEELIANRESELFNIIWSELKPLFCAKPKAWITQSRYHARH